MRPVANGIRIAGTLDGAKDALELSGVFIANGHKPNTEMFAGQLAIENGYTVTQAWRAGMATQSSVPGVFAAGDVPDLIYRQAVTSAASGCQAALDVERFLDDLTQRGAVDAEPVSA